MGMVVDVVDPCLVVVTTEVVVVDVEIVVVGQTGSGPCRRSLLVRITQRVVGGQSKTMPGAPFRTGPMPGACSAVAQSLGAMSAKRRAVSSGLAPRWAGIPPDTIQLRSDWAAIVMDRCPLCC